MNLFLAQVSCVFIATRPEVALVAKEELVFRSSKCPNSDVELPPFVEQWPLDVLLNNQVSKVLVLVYQLTDAIEVIQDVNALALESVRWFDYPYVLLAVFGGSSLICYVLAQIAQLIVPLDKRLVFTGVEVRAD